MKRFISRLGAFLALVAATGMLSAQPAVADHHEAKMAKSTVKDEMLAWITDAEDKLIQLAEATPQDKYTWRPMEGVRSTGEVFMHVCAANYGIPSMWGVTPPEGFKFEGYEQSKTKKEDIIADLKASFAHMKKSLKEADDATLTKETKLFGQLTTSVRGGYMMVLSHVHEHLGQSIAYARTNEIVPPWSAKQAAGGEGDSKE